MDWVAAIAGALLFLSIGLELLAHQFFGRTSLATLLLAIYLSFWSFVLGVAFVVVLALRWLLLMWRRLRAARVSLRQDSLAGLQQWPLEQPERPGHLVNACEAHDDYHHK